jgi:hypothetical protein
VIATGWLAEKIIPHCHGRHPIQYEPNLSLLGLRLIHRLNERRRA